MTRGPGGSAPARVALLLAPLGCSIPETISLSLAISPSDLPSGSFFATTINFTSP